jgi:hypothetical protein
MRDRMAAKSSTAARAGAVAERGTLVLVSLAAWLVPGAGHFWLGRRQKAAVFLGALIAMFAVGLLLEGRIFPFEPSEPLVFLEAVANIGLGGPWLLARMIGAGAGTVTAVTYEYGNAFLLVAGLLNYLIILDAFDIAMGRK